ncbi:MAG: biotin--[acetyl-CoA-carboxylase] ligase [Pseudonocardia sp.]|nr:biotin--[acetyl-CoA-carboxylase] ligase [Pseudonocardia sp.]
MPWQNERTHGQWFYSAAVDGEPLDVCALRTALAERAKRVARLDVVERTGSTNVDLLAAARAGAPDRSVLIAERQDAGRGRLDRSWASPPGAGLTFSVLLRPSEVPPARLGWLPLLAGLSVLRAVRGCTTLPSALKWPNDVLLGPAHGKCAGILAEACHGVERGDQAIVVGIGLNVGTRRDELPPGATSLRAEGVQVDRADVVVALLGQLLEDETRWRSARGDPDAIGLRVAYRQECATLNRPVRVALPGGAVLTGTARDVDGDGRLVLREDSGALRSVAAGDVVHVRAMPS